MPNSIVHPFKNEMFGNLRVIEDGGKPYFCGKDVAAALGYKDTNNAMKQHCRGVVNRHPITDSLGRSQYANFITEGDVYRLIASSKLPNAVQFESWVFDEVLPSIRKDGGYIAASADETPEQIMARALRIADETLKRQQATIEELKPKALFADAVAASDGTCLVGELAKMMRQNGLEIGQNRLFTVLRNDGFLGKSGSNRNVPTQYAMELGLFRIKETAVTHSDGHVTISRTPKVTGKGQRYFIERYCSGDAA